MLVAANSAGAVLGGALLEATHFLKPTARAAVLSTLVWSLCMLGFAVAHNYLLALLLLVGAGAANLAANSIAQTLVQLLAPAETRGRIVGVFTTASAGLRFGSGITIGLLGGLIGIHWSLGLSAAVLILLVPILLVFIARAGAQQTPAPQLQSAT